MSELGSQNHRPIRRIDQKPIRHINLLIPIWRIRSFDTPYGSITTDTKYNSYVEIAGEESGNQRGSRCCVGAPADTKDVPIVDVGGQADPAPVQAPQQPPSPPPALARTMP
ncbi:hypothetical protein Tco_1422659 [Tanacetum coccineum]